MFGSSLLACLLAPFQPVSVHGIGLRQVAGEARALKAIAWRDCQRQTGRSALLCMRCSCDHCTDCQVVAVVKEVGSTARLALEVLRNGGSRQGQWAQDGCSLPPHPAEMKKRVPLVLELLMKKLPGAAGTGGACSAGAAVPAGSTCAGIGKAHDACGVGQGLGSVRVHAEAEPVVLGTAGGAIGAIGLSTPPTRVGGRCCDTTPPKVPAFPTT